MHSSGNIHRTEPFKIGMWATVVISLIALLIGGCHSHPVDPILEEAFGLHQEAIAVNKAIREKLQSVEANDSLMNNIRKRLQTWEENLVEVPGFEHDHDHSHGGHHHHHDHGNELEVTPADMKIIQQEFLDSIQVIKQEVESYLNR